MMELRGVVLGVKSEEFKGRDGQPAVFHRMTTADPATGTVVVVKLPGRLMAHMSGNLDRLRTFGQHVLVRCHPATYSDFGSIKGCVEAEQVFLVTEDGEVVDAAAPQMASASARPLTDNGSGGDLPAPGELSGDTGA